LKSNFELYICKDENNSFWSTYGLILDLVKLDHRVEDFITYAQKNGQGFNIFGINKFYKSNLRGLKIGNL
jgi:hypothetical protein